MPMRHVSSSLSWLIILLLCSALAGGCRKPKVPVRDGGGADVSAPIDGAVAPDSAPADAGQPDAGASDGSLDRALPSDAANLDAGHDTSAPDAALPDGKQPEAGAPDAGLPDAAQPDVALPDGPAVDSGGTVVPSWVKIKAGTFMMGSLPGEPCRVMYPWLPAENPHLVTLTNAFEIQSTEVTRGQFTTVMGYDPSPFTASCGSACPAQMVSWHEAAAYCNALSVQAGYTSCYSCSGTGSKVSCTSLYASGGASVYDCKGFRLPTEAEFEYAYRAGTATAYYNGVPNATLCGSCSGKDVKASTIAWYCANTTQIHPVGLKAPNAWGLYDMAGNVAEWTHDLWIPDLGSLPVTNPVQNSVYWTTESTVRGGSFLADVGKLRAASRVGGTLTQRVISIGFRCVRTSF